ncbi:MAG: transcription-repair coupling factor [Gammaproteobacteria bacterium]|nr:transcription-repair coupling factor [Gammaproteobacteria bacterium]
MTSSAIEALPADALAVRPGERLSWAGLADGAASYFAAKAGAAHPGLTLIATNNAAAAVRCLEEVRFYAPPGTDILHFPAWETLPYDAFSPHQDIISERLATLRQLPAIKRGILVVPAATLMQRLPPRAFIDGRALSLKVGERFDMHAERRRLEAAGYLAVDTVAHRGEFAVRGSLMDIFPMGLGNPVRIDLLDVEIDTLRTFDVETQMTIEQVPGIDVLPAKEFPFDAASIARFRNNWHDAFDVDVRRCSVYQDVSASLSPNGVEYYLPLFFDRGELATLFDYLPANTLILQQAGMSDAVEQFWSLVSSRHQSLAHDIERPVLAPEALYLNPEAFNRHLNEQSRIALGPDFKHRVQFDCPPLPPLEANARLKEPAQALLGFVAEHPEARILFTAESAGRRALFEEFLTHAGISTQDCADWADFCASGCQRGLTVAPIDRGLQLPGNIVITESQIFGHRPATDRASGTRTVDPEQVIRNLTELSIGSPVVHEEHGIGRYRGLQTLDIDGAQSEFLTLEYADGAKLYVPVTSLHLISRYAGADEELAPLHRLGSDQWEKVRRKAAEKAVDVAAELLDLSARRAARTAPALRCEAAEYESFARQFPFDLTTDQAEAIDAVLVDIGSEKSTDRLICGDVGFGKTEVAMRAAFVAVQSGRQVAVLTPTTLLAQQHYDTFQDRFADWPVHIEVVSRLRSAGEVQDIGKRLSKGQVDILIGTHRLLGAGIDFKNLGLIVIDEEHRFGVRQKERLRALRAEVDVVTLTATPIPRTLNLALGGLRDLSIIATPPAKRLSINTFVHEKRNHIIREALNRELMRGGQVFYVHNQVRTIHQAADTVKALVPEARVGVGHGQMGKRQIEGVMSDFHHRRVNVLVCTTIIENGIDIPNANTIIIERADKFGLAQLHQLRGRVGRSHRQAYAYLLTPHPSAMTADAAKRLLAIEAAGELGVGFTLATQDLEIRGAGELLGAEQSGQIESVGFSLYMQMLDRAVKAIQAGNPPDMARPFTPVSREVNLHCGTLIPEDYLPDVHLRLVMYKRISAAATQGQLDELRAEMIDRFGHLPPPLAQLFQVTALKLRLTPLGITRFELGERGGKVEFSDATPVSPASVIALVQGNPSTYRLTGGTVLRITHGMTDLAARFAFADELLAALAPETPIVNAAAAGG